MICDTCSSHKVSKATVLQKSIDYIQFVQQQKKKQEDDLSLLRKEVIALQIMRANYEQLVKAHQSQPSTSEDFVPSEVKFQTFQLLMDTLFQSFNEHVRMNTFSELSGCVFSWLEEHCKPQLLQDLMCNILHQVRESYEATDGVGTQRSIQAQKEEPTRGPSSQWLLGWLFRVHYEKSIRSSSDHPGPSSTLENMSCLDSLLNSSFPWLRIHKMQLWTHYLPIYLHYYMQIAHLKNRWTRIDWLQQDFFCKTSKLFYREVFQNIRGCVDWFANKVLSHKKFICFCWCLNNETKRVREENKWLFNWLFCCFCLPPFCIKSAPIFMNSEYRPEIEGRNFYKVRWSKTS